MLCDNTAGKGILCSSPLSTIQIDERSIKYGQSRWALCLNKGHDDDTQQQRREN
jgi:hypothetical protein